MKKSSVYGELPGWVDARGGRDAWTKWANGRAESFSKRAKKAGGDSALHTVPTWRAVIVEALQDMSDGIGYYSKLPLSLDRDPTHALYPSADHVEGVCCFKVVIETRLVNDMKTILSEKEFELMLGHLVAVNHIPVRALAVDWTCERSFGKKVPG